MRPTSLTWAPPFYFLYYAAAAALVPFLVLYYQEIGLTGSQIGFLAGLFPFISWISAPAWGALADRTGRHRLLLGVMIGGAMGWALALPALRAFAWLVPAVALFSFFFAPIMPVVDSTTMHLLGARKESYGRIRLWGAIGWGVAAPIVGQLTESGGLRWLFWAFAGLLGLCLPLVRSIPPVQRNGASPRRELRRFWKDPRWPAFLAATFCGGAVLSVIGNFLFIFLDGLGADRRTLGLMLTAATLSELPVLFLSDRMLGRWSARQLIGVALFLYAVRGAALSALSTPTPALFLQLLHGPTFSLMWFAGVSYADAIAPAGFAATAQGIFSGVLLGIGSAGGAMVGGVVYEHFGPVNLFRFAALISLVGLGFLLLRRDYEPSVRPSGGR
jgi:PPP family 3-phenylpropionic acid transporter